MERVVIIGGGQASAWAAYTLREEGFEGEIAVISDESQLFYERPPLSKQVLLGEMDHQNLHFFPPEKIAALNLILYAPLSATKIDRDKQVVTLSDGSSLLYDKLLIATGSQARVPVDAWRSLPNLFTLRTVEDSLALQRALPSIKSLAIIGGGWIGLEIASSLRKQGCAVTLLELGERLCARSVSVEVSDFIESIHHEEGVELCFECGLLDIVAEDGKLTLLRDGKKWRSFDAIVVGAGAHINKELAVEAGLETRDGIVVDHYCQTSDPHIYAAGDVAIHPDLGFSIQSWANAQHQGVIAAKAMLGEERATPYRETPWLWSDQYDCNIQILGTPVGLDVTEVVVRDSGPRQKSFFYLTPEGRLQYLVSINDARVVQIAKRWIKADRVLKAIEIGDPAFNVMTLR
ncbi:NAD(P)/FAD-dependent oxidoreductase [Ignatzschineria cameli]|uniref:FAD-dependent oxidoreductase n=1 Tax=Ignatzschineria cameli TaxID=2182793 RepID=A0A2U2AR92_9GAMM|nr:FAD-dependent oxidoreductase [Ignatzschineria cameli]PWD85167.1 FAD-dependent oxidoreductase [Ignatzschineria cameli]PWD86407.1 FAD-dependent oxidoreductase [Ignatzschineria cameli]PWD89755.1 FAD-dependent oxidoreductase [Ignatzschineria cameli]PWD91405.1 FAD-dependent oxidoreductase [Ignatzschineria cameli]PWD92443.1 FAD-dependent oxidoreductase [Ignatzschineria cameli]